MPYHDAVPQDTSLQPGEYLELWEGSRFTQRQDLLSEDDGEKYQNGNGQNVDLPRNQELDAPLPKAEDDEGKKQSPDNSENDNSAHHLKNQGSSNTRASGLAPTWLSTPLLRQQNQSLDDREKTRGEAEKWCPVCSARSPQSCMCNSPMHAVDINTTASMDQSTYVHWLSMQGTAMHANSQHQRPGREFDGAKDDEFGIDRQQTRLATELNLSGAAHGSRVAEPFLEPLSHPSGAGPRYAGEYSRASEWDSARQEAEWEELRKRCLITNHPLYAEMLANHAACLRVGTPVDQLASIESQLAQAPNVTEKYRGLRDQIADISQEEQAELDRFMAEYTCILGTFKDLLSNHVYSDVTEAMMSCWELEQALVALTGAHPEVSHGATMSDDDEDYDSDYGSYDQHSMDYNDSGAYGPLVPTETERTLMERVRQELKHELKQGYKSKIEDVREEILRKRRAGKLPEGTTTVLKAWWQAHSKWPYPTEDEKELLIQETGLELKQVNNWFINQRKRNWHSNSQISSQSESKNKARKSW